MIRLEMKDYNAILKEKQQKQEKLINMNVLQIKKYDPMIKVEQQNKLSLLILFQEKLLKNKQKQLNNKDKKVEALKVLKPAAQN